MLDLQKEIELKYNKNNINSVLKSLINNQKVIELMFDVSSYIQKDYNNAEKDIRINKIKNIKLSELVEYIMIQIIKLDRSKSPIQAIMAPIIDNKLSMMNTKDAAITAIELLIIFAEKDMCKIDIYEDTNSMLVSSKIPINNEVRNIINNYNYLPPLLVQPKKITTNHGNGYYTNKKESVILGKNNHHEYFLNLKALNIASNVALSLDENILDLEELPKHELKTIRQKRAYKQYIESSNTMYELIYNNGNKFYFSWKFDKRGRMYSQGYEINIQSTEYKKAVINLNKKHMITKDI